MLYLLLLGSVAMLIIFGAFLAETGRATKAILEKLKK